MAEYYELIAEALGGPKLPPRSPRNELDLVELVHQGLTQQTLFHLASTLALSLTEIASIVRLSVQTLEGFRQKPDIKGKLLESTVCDRLVELAKLYAYGLQVLGKEKFLQWIKTPQRFLEGRCPKDLFSTSVGIELLKSELNRIEYSVFE